uniref:Uncharacterized protein n=1 Tax=Arundo donax TaxID=35708 RepID=A0A0A8XXI0_ARUDO
MSNSCLLYHLSFVVKLNVKSCLSFYYIPMLRGTIFL